LAPIGHIATTAQIPDVLARARQRASLLPDCLLEAKRVANSVISGLHGRKKRGIGENFWQFRPYSDGESMSRIDWRRSAKDNHTYIRDREWEAAHTVHLWADRSASMLFQSNQVQVSKESRALVLMLAMAEILARSNERIGSPDLIEPSANRNAAERLATALARSEAKAGFPQLENLRGPGHIVLFSDFLDPVAQTLARLAPLAQRGLRGHVVEIADPAEETFPYSGRTEFLDPETGEKLIAGRAETLRDAYHNAYLARREELSRSLQRMGWTYTLHHTDRLASEALTTLHIKLSGNGMEAG
jgi:uncharacterized protein (DUF58 family)